MNKRLETYSRVRPHGGVGEERESVCVCTCVRLGLGHGPHFHVQGERAAPASCLHLTPGRQVCLPLSLVQGRRKRPGHGDPDGLQQTPPPIYLFLPLGPALGTHSTEILYPWKVLVPARWPQRCPRRQREGTKDALVVQFVPSHLSPKVEGPV